MGRILLEGMRFKARHGYYETEGILGNEFVVDVLLEGKFEEAAISDRLELGIDYEQIYLIVKYAMVQEEPVNLLETIAHRIVERIQERSKEIIEDVNVVIRKVNPPLGGRVQYSMVDTDGRVGLENMVFYVPLYADLSNKSAEKVVNNEVTATVIVLTDVAIAAESDYLEDTLNYEAIYWAAKIELQKPVQLLENAAYRIANHLKQRHDNLKGILVELMRKTPAVRGFMPEARVEIDFDHETVCPKCDSDMLCYQDDNCWCKGWKVFPATQHMIDTKYEGCLCENCLQQYGQKMVRK